LTRWRAHFSAGGEVFGDESHWPASASVGVSDLLLGARIEIDAVAVIDSPAAVNP
jgi:enamine deaminase RidA (YjgF/YER057c/UK114 family)